MPPVAAGGAVVAAGAATTTTATAATVTAATIATQAAIGFGLSALSFGVQYFLNKDKGTFGNSNERNYQGNGTSTETYLPVIYGKNKIGLNKVFFDTDPGNKDWMYIVGAFAHGTINKVKKIYVDDKVLAVYSDYKKKWVVDDDYVGYVGQISINNGSDNAKHFSFVGKKFSAWSDDKIGRGVASIAIALRSDTDRFPGGVPNVTLVVKGNKKVYDPRDGEYKYTDNLALCYLDSLRNKRYGDAVPDNEIDFDNFAAEANYCDEVIEGDPIEVPSKCKPSARAMKCRLEKNATYKYRVAAASTKTSYYHGTQTVYNSITELGAVSSVSITSGKGRVSATITPTTTYDENIDQLKIYRTTANGSTYYFLKEINYSSEDYDNGEQELSFDDNLSDEDLLLNEIYSDTGWGDDEEPGTSSISATFNDYTSNLTVDKYYRYKIIYGDKTSPNGKYTQGGIRSKAVKTKQGKKAIRLFDIPISDDRNVEVRVIYRTVGMDTANEDNDDNSKYKYLFTIDDNDDTEEYIDITADSVAADSNTYGFPATCPTVAILTSGSMPRYTINGIMDTSRGVIRNLEEMLACAVAKSDFAGGKWRLHIKKPSVASTTTINRDNVIGNWSFNLPGADILCNYVRASFNNPKANYQTDYVTFPPKKNLNQYLIDDNRFENVKEIELPYVNDKRAAQRIAMITRNLARHSITSSIKVKEELLKCKIGSVIEAELETPGWDGKKFWIEGFSVGIDGTNYITLSEYNADAFDLQYLEADPPDDSDTNLPDPTDAPDGVTNVQIVEEWYEDGIAANWRFKVTYDEPDTKSSAWSHSLVYVKRGKDTSTFTSEYYYDQQISKENQGVFYIYPIEAYVDYYIKILSVSTLGVQQHLDDEDVVEYTDKITLDDPSKPSGFKPIGRVYNQLDENGIETGTYIFSGGDLNLGWNPYATNVDDNLADNEFALEHTKNTLQGFTYYLAIYNNYDNSVKIGSVQVNQQPVFETYLTDNKFTYSLAQNIEGTNKVLASLTNASIRSQKTNYQLWYDWYYGRPYWNLRCVLKVIDSYSKESGAVTIYVENPKPENYNVDGDIETLELTALESAIEAKWQHFYSNDIANETIRPEYDITHYYLKYCRIGEWIAGENYTTNSTGIPKHFITGGNNSLWECYKSGTSGATIPSEISAGTDPGYVVEDNIGGGTTKWVYIPQSGAVGIFADDSNLYATKIKTITNVFPTTEFINNTEIIHSIVSIGTSDTDVANASYAKTIERLDPKYKYLVGVNAVDSFGSRGQSPLYIWSILKPGQTKDDDETQIEAPTTPTLGGSPLQEANKTMSDGTIINRLRFKWDNNSRHSSDSDIKHYFVQFVSVAKSDAVYTDFPTEEVLQTAIEDGYITIGVDTYELSEYHEEKPESSGTTTRTYLKDNVETGNTYFARVKAVNTSGLESAYTAVTADTTLSIAGDIEGVVMDSVSPSTIVVTELSEYLKIEVNITTPPDDLWGCKFAVKTSAFTDTASSAGGRADRESNKTAEIAAKEGKVVYYFAGNTADTYYVSAMPIDTSKNEAKLGGVISWLDASSSYSVLGISHAALGYAWKKFKFDGEIKSNAYNKVRWKNHSVDHPSDGYGTLKVKSSTTESYQITNVTYQTVTGDNILCWLPSASTQFSLVNYTDYFTDSAYATAIAIARVSANIDTVQNAVIVDYEGNDFSIASSMISANAIEAAHVRAGQIDATKMNVTTLSSITSNLGTATAGTLAMPSGTPRIYIDSATPIVKISKSGYNAATETNPDNLIFSSAYNYFKIIAQGIDYVSITQEATVSPGDYYGDETVVKVVSGVSSAMAAIGFMNLGSVGNPEIMMFPFRIRSGSVPHEIQYSISYRPNTQEVLLNRQVWNYSSTSQIINMTAQNVTWYLLGETIGT